MKTKIVMVSITLVVVIAFLFSMNFKSKGPDNVLINLDRSDLIRMKKFVSRFNEGKFDYLIAVVPTIEGSYIFYDFISTGSEVTFSIDSSRDPYSVDNVIKKYQCKGISISHKVEMEGISGLLEVSDCTGDQTIKKAGILTFRY
ncbi:DUF4362 domain-containing protein [Paenibacillus wynnii]|uniref:DUF4362 domain-containing protein n=1 Tax=Paenibacillus wynnii TaxID=268407 RepID=UPI0012FBB959|nr:DUF4362 domain-containing protein [Paenibacillus wynnii]